MAMESPRVVADIIEIQEFPHLAQSYTVMGVPKTVINDTVQFTGAMTEETLLRRVLEAVGEDQSEVGAERPVSDRMTPIG